MQTFVDVCFDPFRPTCTPVLSLASGIGIWIVIGSGIGIRIGIGIGIEIGVGIGNGIGTVSENISDLIPSH